MPLHSKSQPPLAMMGLEKLANFMNLGLIGLICIAWFALLCMRGWHQDVTLTKTLDVGLMKVDVTDGVAVMVTNPVIEKHSAWLSDRLQSIASGTKSVETVRQEMCSGSELIMSAPVCDAWVRLWYASIGVLFFVACGIILFAIAAVFSYQYWLHEARAETRLYVRYLLTTAPALQFLSVWVYIFMTSDLGGTTSNWTYGVATEMAAMLTLFSFLPLLVSEVFSGTSNEEHLNEAIFNEKRRALESTRNKGYGMATMSGVAPLETGSSGNWHSGPPQNTTQGMV